MLVVRRSLAHDLALGPAADFSALPLGFPQHCIYPQFDLGSL
jgi:hypothetical protein